MNAPVLVRVEVMYSSILMIPEIGWCVYELDELGVVQGGNEGDGLLLAAE